VSVAEQTGWARLCLRGGAWQRAGSHCPPTRGAHRSGSADTHPHKHDANYPPKKDRGAASCGRV